MRYAIGPLLAARLAIEGLELPSSLVCAKLSAPIMARAISVVGCGVADLPHEKVNLSTSTPLLS